MSLFTPQLVNDTSWLHMASLPRIKNCLLSHIKTLSNQAKTSSMVPQNPKFSRINHKKIFNVLISAFYPIHNLKLVKQYTLSFLVQYKTHAFCNTLKVHFYLNTQKKALELHTVVVTLPQYHLFADYSIMSIHTKSIGEIDYMGGQIPKVQPVILHQPWTRLNTSLNLPKVVNFWQKQTKPMHIH